MIPITIGKPLMLNVENESKKNTNVSRKFLEHNNQIYKSDEFFDVKKYKIYLTNELKNNSGLKHIKKIIDEIITDITFLNNTEDKIFILMDIIC
ncbi:hypothetical protein J7J90_01400, partial [Candidatus Micrarchaeota archaeon]|nr:hypothetical protein [Candidatus Micrarchaeota archaeon]